MSDPTAGLFKKMPARVKIPNEHDGLVAEDSDSGSEVADVDIIVEKLVAETNGAQEMRDKNADEANSERTVDCDNTPCGSNISQACEEDNLHGLSITPQPDISATENHSMSAKESIEIEMNLDKLDLKNDRPNPFNGSLHQSAASSPASQSGSAATGNFVALESFGNDEIAGSFIPAGIGGLSTFNRGGSGTVSKKVTKNSPAFTSGPMNDVSFSNEQNVPNSIDLQTLPISSSPSANTDPWVKLAEDGAEDVVIPSAAPAQSPKVETKPTPPEKSTAGPIKHSEKIPNDRTPTPETGVPLDSLVIDVPGPCEPEDLIEGIIFSANYLGTTQLMSNRNPAKNARMFQAQEAVNRIKAPDGESQPTVEVDLFISTSKIKILNADTQETMMGHTLRSISYIADVGDLLVIMAKRHSPSDPEGEDEQAMVGKDQPKRQRIICHVLSSSDSHLISESIGQCFNVAYQQFLQSNCIEPQSLTQADFNNILDTQEMYHDDLVHYSKQENVKEIWIEKKKGEAMGIAIVESGWGSIIPTVILANLQHGSPMERNGKFSIGDQIMSINNTSLVGLPLQTCHSIIKGLRNQTLVKVNIVSCPPVVSVLIKRPDLKHQLGFSVQNGIICSLMRGGIAERGGVRVGHRIIEISNQSVVATPHDKIVQMLVTSVGEIQMKTMPAAMYRLLTGQEQPIYL